MQSSTGEELCDVFCEKMKNIKKRNFNVFFPKRYYVGVGGNESHLDHIWIILLPSNGLTNLLTHFSVFLPSSQHTVLDIKGQKKDASCNQQSSILFTSKNIHNISCFLFKLPPIPHVRSTETLRFETLWSE